MSIPADTALEDPVREKDDETIVRELVDRAKEAQACFGRYSQEKVDEVVTAVAWAAVNPDHVRMLAETSVENSGLGKVEDNMSNLKRKVIGTLHDLYDAKTVGVISDNPETGITEIARPVGVVGALVPSTSSSLTPVTKVMNALKGRNAIILSPSPKGYQASVTLMDLIHAELERVGAPIDIVQQLPSPITKQRTAELMHQVDLVVVTGSENNVRAAYSSGTPALGVSAGNASVYVDRSAELEEAAHKIARSKSFNNATSCSAENSVVIEDAVYADMLAALEAAGGAVLTPDEKQKLQDVMWQDGRLQRTTLGKDAATISKIVGLDRPPLSAARFLMVEEEGVGPDHPFSGEKISPVLTVYRARDFDHACEIMRSILEYQGAGHSCGIHTQNDDQIMRLGLEMPVCRVIVNQPHSAGTGGSSETGVPYTNSLGCGTWGKNSTCDNINYKNFLNITRIIRTIPPVEPDEKQLLGAFRAKYGL